jgi:outer membrane protein OmpA-like peptidoglycan-associated protein
MSRRASILVGTILVALGACGLIGINIVLVPGLFPPIAPLTTSWTEPTAEPARVAGGAPAQIAAAASSPALAAEQRPGAPSSAEADDAGAAAPGPEPSAVPAASAEAPAAQQARFEPGKAGPTPGVRAAAEQAAAQARRERASKVVLVGHGDEPAAPGDYLRMGRTRAVIVMQVLRELGVEVGRIAIESPPVVGGAVQTGGVAPGTVEIKVVALDAKEKGARHVP